MDAIRKFIDFAGPAVYVVMIVLCVYLVSEAGGSATSASTCPRCSVSFGESIPMMIAAIALVVSYFSGPMLNFGDFSRYAKSFKAVRKGNWLGLPLNFLFFSILTVVTASATVPVFGELITDPIETVQRIDSGFAILLGGLTFVIATIGINIVANFISPAFDFSNVNPKKISWRMGGMIAAVGSVLLTPWNWYNSDDGILYTLGILGGLIGPLFGVLIAGYYLVSKQKVWVDDMFVMTTTGRYWFRNGYNPNAVAAAIIGGSPAIAMVLTAGVCSSKSENVLLSHGGDFSWFVGCGLGLLPSGCWRSTTRRSPVWTSSPSWPRTAPRSSQRLVSWIGPDQATKAEVPGGGVLGLALSGRRSVAQAVVGCAQMRAALDHPARVRLGGRRRRAGRGAAAGGVAGRPRVDRPLPDVAGDIQQPVAVGGERRRPARCRRSRRPAGSATGTRPARCWPVRLWGMSSSPQANRAPSNPPRAAYSHSVSVGSSLPAQAAYAWRRTGTRG